MIFECILFVYFGTYTRVSSTVIVNQWSLFDVEISMIKKTHAWVHVTQFIIWTSLPPIFGGKVLLCGCDIC